MALTTLITSILYFAGLFWLARWGDSSSPTARKFSRHPAVYSLTLAIYCTSWTYYGAVGNAANGGWSYLPIYIGPVLLLVIGFPFLKKILDISKKQNLTSLADFLSSRYGKRRNVSIMVTLIALLATIPYIALQLKALGMSFSIVANSEGESWLRNDDMVLVATAIMSFFAIAFGTRKVDITEYRGGLMLAIAMESVVKLLALIAVAVFSFSLTDIGSSFNTTAFADWEMQDFYSANFLTQTLMGAAAFICLPRQFHVAIVDNQNPRDLVTARWMFPIYLVLICAAIIPITVAGLNSFTQGSVNADTYVLTLPLLTNNAFLTIVAFIGGLSAATAMIIVATLALSNMISNDVMLPLLFRKDQDNLEQSGDLSQRIIMIRRLTIIGILLSGYLYHQLFSSNAALSNIGLIAFSLVIQLMPVLIGAVYWKTGHAKGAYAGMGAGLFIILLFVLNPDPEVNVRQTDYLVAMVLTSITLNATAYIIFSLNAKPRLLDKLQAAAFINPSLDAQEGEKQARINIPNADLITLLRKFLGQKRTENLLTEYRRDNEDELVTNEIATTDFVQHCELLIGGVIGASSSRSVMSAVLSGKAIKFEDMLTFFGDTTDALSFNQNILYTSLESLDQGISVVNEELQLVAWNKRYLELFNYPTELIKVGTPIEHLIRYNAEHGECGPGEVEQHVTKRMNFMRTGSAHRFLRERADGSVIEMVGNPLPKGGFVTSFTDITEHIETQQALNESNIDLEKRIQDRSQEVSEINTALKAEIERRSFVEEALKVAKADAEQANALKTRFLALASHDILQPLNAAKLYLASVEKTNLDTENREILEKVGISLTSTESLIQTLLEISRLDEGMIENDEKVFALSEILKPLLHDFAIVAEQKGLKFHSHVRDAVVKTDPIHLRRITQNLISNAIKYTRSGGVLVACRMKGNKACIEIYDTGPGISEYEQTQIYNEFYRIRGHNEPGVGLGLAVVSRLSDLLELSIEIKSNLGRGTRFSYCLDMVDQPAEQTTFTPVTAKKSNIDLNVMCIDDEQENLNALAALLKKWGCENHSYTSPDDFISNLKAVAPDILLVDFQLNDEHYNGIELVAECRRLLKREIPAVLITAVRDKSLRAETKEAHISYLPKPVRPAALRALLSKHV